MKFSDLFSSWLNERPEFDTAILRSKKCWPISSEHYHPFTINKRNGSTRNLVAVNKELKNIQLNLSKYLSKNYPVSKYTHGFINNKNYFSNINDNKKHEKIRAKGVISNALLHTNKKLVISIDLKNFFPSITLPRLIGLFKSRPYNYSHKQAAILANLVCLPKSLDRNQGLPQGAPSSPIISNLICKKMDIQIGKIAKKYDYEYSRYADDITLSTNNIKKTSPNEIINEARKCIERNGFRINNEKTKVMYRNQSQMVTGILVNDGLNLQKKQIDALRATLYNLENKYETIDDAVLDYRKKPNKPYDPFPPVGHYNFINHRRKYIKSPGQGLKKQMPIEKDKFNQIYANHLLGRILWYGQVVCTSIKNPYQLTNREKISPKQHSRILKFEEMLASYYRICRKFNWGNEHIILRLNNNFPHLQSLIKTKTKTQLEPIILSRDEEILKNKADSLTTIKEDYNNFFKGSPKDLQRVLVVLNRSNTNFNLDHIRKCMKNGWPVPSKQAILFKSLDNGDLSDLFHKSVSNNGHNITELTEKLVEVCKPLLRYLSNNIRKNIISVHRELVNIIRSEGENAFVDLGVETPKTKDVFQAIRDLKSSVRLYEDDTNNFYRQIVLEAVDQTDSHNIIKIEQSGMAPRLVTDIAAWRDALIKILQSLKEHTDKSELSSSNTPYILCFEDENPIEIKPRRIKIYKLNDKTPFKKKLEPTPNPTSGTLNKWLAGGDFQAAIRSFLPIGDIWVHGDFKDCKAYNVNLTRHTYEKQNTENERFKGAVLFITLSENIEI